MRWLFVLVVISGIGAVISLAWIGLSESHRSQQNAQMRERLKTLGIALQNFHDVHGHFPSAYEVDESGEPAHSWRVALLPHLGQKTLFENYSFDDNWDAAANRGAQESMPDSYRSPGVSQENATGFQAITGPQTAWPLHHSAMIRDFQDGTSNTALLIDNSDNPVIWTSPQDTTWQSVARGVPVRNNGLPVTILLGDGSVRAIPDSIDPMLWRALLSTQGGRPVSRIDWAKEIASGRAPLPFAPTDYDFDPPVDVDSIESAFMSPLTETPLEPGRSAIYCPTFALAWRSYVDAWPDTLQTAFASKLLQLEFEASDISPSAVRVNVGDVRNEGVWCRLEKFLPFQYAFQRFQEPLSFDAGNRRLPVQAFGVTSHHDDFADALSQTIVDDYRSPDEFVLRITVPSGDQVVLTRIPQPSSLNEAIQESLDRIENGTVRAGGDRVVKGEELVIPILEISLLADFLRDVQHPQQRPGTRIVRAEQTVQFRLDETGGVLLSEAVVIGENGAHSPDEPAEKVGERKFIFNKPFLLLLRESDTQRPYLAAWLGSTDFFVAHE